MQEYRPIGPRRSAGCNIRRGYSENRGHTTVPISDDLSRSRAVEELTSIYARDP